MQGTKTVTLFYPTLDSGAFSLQSFPLTAYKTPKAVVPLPYDSSSHRLEISERDSVERALRKNGFEITYSLYRWARDNIVYYKGNVLDSYLFSALGTGGIVLEGSNFVLFSTVISDVPLQAVRTSLELFHVTGPQNKTVFETLFPNARPFLLKPMQNSDGTHYSSTHHIDLTVGSIPALNLVTVDCMHYMQQRSVFDSLGKMGIEVRVTEPKSDAQRRLYGNNYFVASEGREKPFVLVNRGSTEVLSALEDFRGKIDIETTDTDIVVHPTIQEGGIRCMTNISHAPAISTFFERIDFFGPDLEPIIMKSAEAGKAMHGVSPQDIMRFSHIAHISMETPAQKNELEEKMKILRCKMAAQTKPAPVIATFREVARALRILK